MKTAAVLALASFLVSASPSAGQSGFLRTPEEYALSIVVVPFDDGTRSLRFVATERLPGASGEAKVERKNGVTEVEIELDEMKPAWDFGGDFNTYLLWAISPEGHVDNMGEFVLNGNRSKLNASTPMDTFGLLVTAEPHFMVENPSSMVVLGNLEPQKATPRPAVRLDVVISSVHPSYRYERADLGMVPEVGDQVRSALRQAQVAVQLAERAGADLMALDALNEAKTALLMSEGAAETRSPTHDDVELMARRTVRLAAAAEKLASRQIQQAAR